MSRPIELTLRGAGGEPVDLWRTLVSHGFMDLAPLRVDASARTLDATIRMPRGRPRRIRIAQGRPGRATVTVVGGPAPSIGARQTLAEGAAHVLRLDQDLSAFYARAADDPDLSWVTAGAGRMLRSPTVWEDVVKTVCTTNCSWSLTTTMVNALVSHLGDAAAGHERDELANAFPTPAALAAQDERFFREVVRSGLSGALLRSSSPSSRPPAARSTWRSWERPAATTSPTMRSSSASSRSRAWVPTPRRTS